MTLNLWLCTLPTRTHPKIPENQFGIMAFCVYIFWCFYGTFCGLRGNGESFWLLFGSILGTFLSFWLPWEAWGLGFRVPGRHFGHLWPRVGPDFEKSSRHGAILAPFLGPGHAIRSRRRSPNTLFAFLPSHPSLKNNLLRTHLFL